MLAPAGWYGWRIYGAIVNTGAIIIVVSVLLNGGQEDIASHKATRRCGDGPLRHALSDVGIG